MPDEDTSCATLEDFKEAFLALKGSSEDKFDFILSQLAGILWLGEVVFESVDGE